MSKIIESGLFKSLSSFPGSIRIVKARSFFICFLGILCYYECLTRLALGVPFFAVGVPLFLLFAVAFAFPAAAVCGLFRVKTGFIIACVFVGIMETIYTVQVFYYFTFNIFPTVFSIINGVDALGFEDNIRATFTQYWPIVLCLLAPFPLFLLFGRKIRMERFPVLRYAVMGGCGIALHFVIAILLLPALGTGYFTPYDYYHNNQTLNQSVDKLGLLTTFRLDAQRYISGLYNPYLDGGSASAPSAQPFPSPVETLSSPPPNTPAKPPILLPAEIPETVYADNVLDVDFDALIANTKDSALLEMHRYFADQTPTGQNEYTGIFEGYNLITITAESFSPYCIDPVLTPTLYKMQQEGFFFADFYCSEWQVSTLDGEYVNCLGLIPKPGVWSLYLSGKRNNYLPFALGNQFSALGYQTYAYHNNTYTYYNRNISHPNMGYTYKGLGNGLEVKNTWPQSDVEMIALSTADYLNGQPFHVYYLTVSGHMAYSWGGNQMSYKHRELVSGLPYSEHAKAYLACNIELDRAMELLLEELEAAGVAGKTVIALSPDHPPYGLTKEEFSEFLGHSVEPVFEYAKSSFLLYNPGMHPQTIDKPCSALDILPTLSNLFGLPYDSRLLTGRDIFSDAAPFIIMGNRSFITDTARFNTETKEVEQMGEQPVDYAYIQEVNALIAEKFKIAAYILDNDYYRLALLE